MAAKDDSFASLSVSVLRLFNTIETLQGVHEREATKFKEMIASRSKVESVFGSYNIGQLEDKLNEQRSIIFKAKEKHNAYVEEYNEVRYKLHNLFGDNEHCLLGNDVDMIF